MPEGKIKFTQARPPDAKELATPAPEMFVLHMSACFGQFPLELGPDQVERLRGMKATWSDVSANPYDALIRAISRWGSVSVWIEYPKNEIEVREILVAEAEKRKMA